MSAQQQHDLSNVTLAVIAGGEGRRMGLAKVLLEVNGQPLPTWLLDRLQWRGETMLVLAPAIPRPRDVERFDRCVVDPVDGLGPLRGILTALENAATDLVAAVAVDMPFVDQHKLVWILDTLQSRPDSLGIMCSTTDHGQTFTQPLPSVLKRTASTVIAQRLANDKRSIHGLCRDDDRFICVPAPSDWADETWTNLNDPDAFKRFEASLNMRTKEN